MLETAARTSIKRAIALGALVLWAGMGWALAAFTPSGTLIETQASATFLDAAAMPREALSNVVVTVVQKVAKVQVSGDPSRAGVAGASLDLPFSVTNAGNDSDTIDLAVSAAGDLAADVAWTIYADENCNGRTDAGESEVASLVLERGERACIVVRVGIAADTDEAPGAQAELTFTATSTTRVTVEDGDDTDATTGTVVLADAPVMSGFLQAIPSAQIAQGDTIAYTLQVSNTGASSACAVEVVGQDTRQGLLVHVAIPEGLTLEGTPNTSSGAGTPRLLYAADGGTWSETPLAAPAQLAMLIEGDGCFFPQGASAELSFALGVSAPSTPGEPHTGPAHGTSYTTSAASEYAISFDGELQSAATNAVTHTVQPAYAVGIDGGDATLASASSGSTIELVRSLRNLGNADDRIHVQVTRPAESDWVCRLYHADGVTTLAGPVGPLAPNATRDVVVRCQIPADDTDDGRQVTFSAHSDGDPSVTADATWTITQVNEGLRVDVALQGVPSDEHAPGSALTFFALVANDGANPDTYALSAVLAVDDGSPGTWSATPRFYPAALSGETCQAITPRPASVSTTGIMATASERCFEVEATVPATASADWQGRVTVTATSTTDAAVLDSAATGTISVALTPGLSFGPERSATVTSPGIVTVTHTVRNTGNAPGTFTIANSSLTPADSGNVLYSWTETGTFYTFASLDAMPLAAGAEATLYVRLIAASAQPPGRRINVSTGATLSYLGAEVERTVTNTYDVIDGTLRLLLEVCTSDTAVSCSGGGSEARPGQYLHYTLVATNLGSAPLAEVVVTEPVPAFTDFVSVQAARSSGFSAGTVEYDGGSGWSATPPVAGSVASGEAVRVRVFDGDQHVPIPAGGSLTITMVVSVR